MSSLPEFLTRSAARHSGYWKAEFDSSDPGMPRQSKATGGTVANLNPSLNVL
jgi:hypothetical protein